MLPYFACSCKLAPYVVDYDLCYIDSIMNWVLNEHIFAINMETGNIILGLKIDISGLWWLICVQPEPSPVVACVAVLSCRELW